MSPTIVPAPVLSSNAEREDWDDSFDVPEGDSLIQHLDSDDLPTRSSTSLKPSRLRMSTGPEDIQPDETEDWDTNLAFSIGARTISGTLPPSALAPPPVSKLSGTINKFTRSNNNVLVEDWDADLDFVPSKLKPKPSQPSSSSSILPITSAEPDWDADDDNDDDDDDGGNASTIKVSRLPPIPHKELPPPPPSQPSAPSRTAEDDDMEDAFALPSDLSHLSLRPLAHRTSKSTIEWSSDTTSSFASEAPTSFGFGNKATSESPSSVPESEFTTDDDDDAEAEAEVEGLLLPDSFLPKDLVKLLEAKKKGVAGTNASSKPIKIAFPPNPDEDFESGLVIDDDSELSPSRLRKGTRGTTHSSRIPPPSGIRPPSRITITRASTAPTPTPAQKAPRDTRSPSPLLKRPPSDLRRLAPSPIPSTSTSTRRSKVSGTIGSGRTNTLSPPLIGGGGPTLNHSFSMLAIPKTPLSPSKLMKHQKSHSRLLTGTGPTAADSSNSSLTSSGKRGLARKASLSSLVDAAASADRHAKAPSSGSGAAGPSGSASGSGAMLHSRGTIGHASSSRYNAPTASSRAKILRSADGVVGSDRNPFHVPPARPTTPSNNPAALRLTMPTTSSRAKARPPISGIFPTTTSSNVMTSGGSGSSSGTSAAPPHPSYSRQSSTSPVQSRPSSGTRSPLRMTTITSTSTSAAVAAANAAKKVKVIRRPKNARTFGDGSELDGFADLPVEKEKERRYRVAPKPFSPPPPPPPLSGAVGSKRGSNTGTLGRKTPVFSGLTPASAPPPVSGTKRPPSAASIRNAEPPPRSAGSSSGLVRHRSIRDFHNSVNTIQAPVLAPAPTPTMYAATRRKRSGAGGHGAAHKKPTLIRNLSGAGSPKVVGDMRWNPITLRWEGNDSVLRDFDSQVHSARPALITHLTGSSVGGMGSPTGFLTNGARIVGNMIFDPSKMCWINRYADEESDPFAGFDDDDFDNKDKDENADEEEDKDATWGKNRNRGDTIRASLKRVGGAGGAPSSGTPLETVAGSPARSAVSRASHHRQSATTSATSASESETESMDNNVSSPGRGERRSALVRGASTSPIPGVDADMVEACRRAEERHRSEMKGWFVSSRRTATRRRRQVGIAVLGDDDDDDWESGTVPNRSYLFDIRTLATRKY